MVKWFKAKLWRKPRARTLFLKAPLLLAGGLVLLVLLVAALFTMPATRGMILNKGLAIAGKSLPGELSWAEAHWSEPGFLEFENVHWVAPDHQGSTELAHVERLAVSLNLSALREKDIRVKGLDLFVEYADVPAIMTILGLPLPADTTQTNAPDSTVAASFPRSGSVPGLPSLALDTGSITVKKIILPDGLVVSDFKMNLDAEAGFGKEARLGIDHLELNLAVTPVDTAGAPFMVGLTHAGLHAHWLDEAKTIVLDSLSVLVAEAGTEELRKSWQTAGPVRLSSQGQVKLDGGSIAGSLDCSFLLPGGEHLSPLIPEGLPAELVGMVQPPVLGFLSLQGALVDDQVEGHLVLDLGNTPWLDRALVHLDFASHRDFQIRNITATLDTLDVALLGTQILVQAEVKHEAMKWSLKLDVADASLPKLFAGEVLHGTDLVFSVDGMGDGTFADPRIGINFNGEFSSPEATVPHLEGYIGGDRHALVANLRVDGPIEAGGVLADSIIVNLNSNIANPDSLVAEFGISAWAPEMMASINGLARRDTIHEVRLDSFIIAAAGLHMRTPRPALLRMDPGKGHFSVDDFSLEGEPGSISINGHWNETGLDFTSNADLFLPEEMLQTIAPNPIWSFDGGIDISLTGGTELKGTPRGPQFDGSLEAKLIPHRGDPPLGLGLDFFLDDGSKGKAGLGADFAIFSGDSLLLHGGARWPGQVNLDEGTWHPAEDDSITIQIPEHLFNLAMLDRMMPPDVELHGDLSLAAGARIASPGGDGLAGDVSGFVLMEKVRVDLPNRSRMVLGLDLALEGTLTEPVVAGDIEIHSGFFRIPELPKALHPTEGTSLLWEAVKADTFAVAGDGLEAWRLAAVSDSLLNVKKPVVMPDLDLVIHLPGNLRVHGYGLDVELGGELKVKRGEDANGMAMPVITGGVEILDGSLRFMNRMFISQSGEIRFAGLAPADPVLDLKLEAEVGSYLIKIAIRGTASEPVIDLTSDPEMNEVDIMSVLFFGQPANNLDNDQRGHMNEESDPGQQLRENLAGLAMVFGTAGISNRMTSTLGVDMLEVGSDSNGESTIMVGKFLTPRIMVKYHQSLEKSGSYFMTLEYSLSRFMKLMSSYGQGDEPSGLELGFTKRY